MKVILILLTIIFIPLYSHRVFPQESSIDWNKINKEAIELSISGKQDRAEEVIKNALAKTESDLGPEHPQVATGLNLLATFYSFQNKHQLSEPLYKRALAIMEKAHGPEHPDVALILNDYANYCRGMGQKEELAQQLYERALAIMEKANRLDDPLVAMILYNLGVMYDLWGIRDTAEQYYKRALRIKENVYGPDSPELLTNLDTMADFYRAISKDKESEELRRKAAHIRALRKARRNAEKK